MKPFIGSFSALNTFCNVCEYQFQRRYIAKNVPFVETAAMAWGNKVHDAFEHRLADKQPLPADMKQWEGFAYPFDQYKVLTEVKLGMTYLYGPCDFFADDVWFRGKVDSVIIEGNKAFILDFKTGNSKYEDPFELQTSAALVAAHHPAVTEFAGSYAWLKENRMSQQYDLSDIEATLDVIANSMASIEEKIASGEWHKKKSALCSWCPVTDCENWYKAR